MSQAVPMEWSKSSHKWKMESCWCTVWDSGSRCNLQQILWRSHLRASQVSIFCWTTAQQYVTHYVGRRSMREATTLQTPRHCTKGHLGLTCFCYTLSITRLNAVPRDCSMNEFQVNEQGEICASTCGNAKTAMLAICSVETLTAAFPVHCNY